MSTQYKHTANGLLATFVPPNGNTLAYSYDAAERLIGIADASGRVTQERERDGQATETVNFSYTSIGQLSTIQYPSRSTVQYTYSADGKIASVSFALSVAIAFYTSLVRLAFSLTSSIVSGKHL